MRDPVSSLSDALWLTGPLRIQRRYSSTRGIIGDGHHLALVPPLAVLAMVVTAVGYLIVGLFGLGFDDVYSESLLLMGSLLALGALSGQLGLTGLTAFSVGHFVFADRAWDFDGRFGSLPEELIRARLPMIISYLLLGVAVLFIPRLGKNLVIGIGRWRAIPSQLAWLITTPAVIVVSWLGLRTWAAVAPTLIRPYFVWSGRLPTAAAIEVLQRETSQLVAWGVAATVVRQVVVGAFLYLPWLRRKLDAIEQRAHAAVVGDAPTAPRAPTTTSTLVADVTGALLAALVLSGILETLPLWLMFFGAFLAIRLLRSGTIRLPPVERWKVIANRAPVVVRLGLIWLAAILYRSFLSNDLIGSYRTMAFIVLIGVVIGFVVFPGRPATPPAAAAVHDGEPSPPAPEDRAVGPAEGLST
ncbi:MAG: hypothetical protein AAF547_13430 [Actinomycetota bacterium]